MGGLIVRALRDGFRRGGVAHPAAETRWPEGSYTPEQAAAWRGEAMLVVTDVAADAPDSADDTGAKPDAPAAKAGKRGKASGDGGA